MAKIRSTSAALVIRLGKSVAAVTGTAAVVALGLQSAYAGISTDHGSPVTLTSFGSLDASGLMAGGVVERVLAIQVPTGARSHFSVTAAVSSVLDQDRQHGLQLHAEQCSSRWTRVAKRFICAGELTSVLASRPILGNSPLSLRTAPVGGQLIRLTLTLPATAGAAFMGQTSALRYRIIS